MVDTVDANCELRPFAGGSPWTSAGRTRWACQSLEDVYEGLTLGLGFLFRVLCSIKGQSSFRPWIRRVVFSARRHGLGFVGPFSWSGTLCKQDLGCGR